LDFFDLDRKKTEGKINEIQYNNIKGALINAQDMLKNLLKVQSLHERIYPNIESDCNWNPKVKKNGVEADFIICVTGVSKNGSVASAAFIENIKYNNRPATAMVSWNPEFVKGSKNEVLSMTSTALHEITHTLVFDESLFSKFVDQNYVPIPKEKSTKTNSNKRLMLTTPNVIEAAKKHFGCNRIDGLELEDDGGDGTKNSHWEERLMRTDFMTGMVTDDSTISEITLSLFDDSGWYKTEKFTGGLFNFGINSGCDIIYEKCVENKKIKALNEFCLKDGDTGCSSNRRFKSFCSIITQKVSDIPPEDIYFDIFEENGNKVVKTGSRPHADNCPLPVEIPKEDYKLFGSCIYGQKNADDSDTISKFEYINSDSACFLTNVMSKESRDSATFGWESISPFYSGCYQYKCDQSNKLLSVIVNNKIYDCPNRGGILKIQESVFQGSIVCPDFYLICNQSIPCNDFQDCVYKKSIRIENNIPMKNDFNVAVGSNLSADLLTKITNAVSKN